MGDRKMRGDNVDLLGDLDADQSEDLQRTLSEGDQDAAEQSDQ